MFARVTRFKEPAEDAIRVTRDQVIPAVLGLPGSRGGYFLVNRDEGTTLSLTLWADRGALEASADPIAELRAERPTSVPGSDVIDVFEYEVIFAPPAADEAVG